MKQFSISILVIIAVITLGCDDGVQHGQFVVCTRASRPFRDSTGKLTIISGNAMPLTPASNCKLPLMYILVAAPGVNESGSGVSGANETYTSTFQWYWAGPQGSAEVKLTWDRRTDTVVACGISFDRKRGNAFVLISTGPGNVTATQVGTINGTPNQSQALQQIQALLPATSPLKNVALIP